MTEAEVSRVCEPGDRVRITTVNGLLPPLTVLALGSGELFAEEEVNDQDLIAIPYGDIERLVVVA